MKITGLGADADMSTWKVACYARLSREDDSAGESESIASQKAIVGKWAHDFGHAQIVATYVDDGYSGATFDRPAFKRMIEDAREGLFDTIAVKDLSRFGRSYLDCGEYIERELPQMGVRLFSVTDGFDSMMQWDYNTALLMPMKNLMNEMQVISTSEKVRASLKAKRERGEFVGNFAPYGYSKDPADKHQLVVDPEAAAVVRRIFALYLQGMGATSIAAALNEDGVLAPGAYRAQYSTVPFMGHVDISSWNAKAVLRILGNEVYTGTLVQGKTRRLNLRSQVRIAVSEDQWKRTYRSHEALISREKFRRAQQIRRARACANGSVGDDADGADADGASNASDRPEGTGGSHRLEDGGSPDNDPKDAASLGGRLYCADCHARMKRIRIASRGKRYVYYVCSAHRSNTRTCSTHSVREDELLAQIRHEHPLPGERLLVSADGVLVRG